MTARPDWTRDQLRAAPGVELLELEQLDAEARAQLEQAAPGPDLYGLLAGADGQTRVATCDVALLVLTLRAPGPLPAYVRRTASGDPARLVARLVVDGVLEVESDGCWLSGPAALRATAPTTDDLSRQALAYGAQLTALGPDLLGTRLYLYGRRPLTRADRDQPVALDAPGAPWHELEHEYWRHWRRPGAATSYGYKLYVSPRPDLLAEAVSAVADAARTVRDATAFKCARDREAALRPDKLVAYTPTLESLHELAGAIRERIDGMPAHGVPFTAPIGGDALLSWGVDPPDQGSWRQWVTQRLADYLIAGGETADPAAYAVDRLALDGVDTTTWTPTGGLFGAMT